MICYVNESFMLKTTQSDGTSRENLIVFKIEFFKGFIFNAFYTNEMTELQKYVCQDFDSIKHKTFQVPTEKCEIHKFL